MRCYAADLSVDYVRLAPSLSTATLPVFRDRAKRSGTPPTSPTFSKYSGVKLGPAGLRRSMAVKHQAVGVSHDRRHPAEHPAESARRLVAARASETPRSLAARDAAPATWKDAAMSVSGTEVSSRVMSSRLKHRRRTSADDVGAVTSLMTPAIQKVSTHSVDANVKIFEMLTRQSSALSFS